MGKAHDLAGVMQLACTYMLFMFGVSRLTERILLMMASHGICSHTDDALG